MSWIIENLSPRNTLALENERVQQGTLQDQNLVRLGTHIDFLFLSQHVEEQTHVTSTPALPVEAQQTLAISPNPQTPASLPIEAQQTIPALPQSLNLASKFAQASPGETMLVRPTTANVPALIVSSNVGGERRVHDLTGQVINLGRNPDNEIVIDNPIVSAQHAQIVRDGDTFFLVHPHPKRGRTVNGLWYQGQHIQGDQSVPQTVATRRYFSYRG